MYRNWKWFTEFCVKEDFIQDPDFFLENQHGLPEGVPTWIVAWIMSR